MAETICVDAGHGGDDPGAIGHGIKEKDYTLKISQYQAKRLQEHGFNVVMTRTADATLSNSTRTSKVKNSGAKVCISNHINAASPSANGAETIYSIHSNGKLANMILDELVQVGFNRRKAFSKRGKRGDYYFMHRETGSVEVIIVEHGFITNAGDVQKLKNNWKQFAEADVKAICEYMGVKYIPKNKKEIKKMPNIPHDWAKKEWNWVHKKGIITGDRPREPITREEVAIIIYNLFNNEAKVDKWAKELWELAEEKSIMDGKRPQAITTRQELATTLCRILKLA